MNLKGIFIVIKKLFFPIFHLFQKEEQFLADSSEAPKSPAPQPLAKTEIEAKPNLF